MGIVMSEPPATDGEDWRDTNGMPFVSTVATGPMPLGPINRQPARPCPEEADAYMLALIVCAVMFAGVGYCLHWLWSRPAALWRWAQGFSSPLLIVMLPLVFAVGSFYYLAR